MLSSNKLVSFLLLISFSQFIHNSDSLRHQKMYILLGNLYNPSYPVGEVKNSYIAIRYYERALKHGNKEVINQINELKRNKDSENQEKEEMIQTHMVLSNNDSDSDSDDEEIRPNDINSKILEDCVEGCPTTAQNTPVEIEGTPNPFSCMSPTVLDDREGSNSTSVTLGMHEDEGKNNSEFVPINQYARITPEDHQIFDEIEGIPNSTSSTDNTTCVMLGTIVEDSDNN